MFLVKNTEEIGSLAADIFADTMKKKADCIIGPATGKISRKFWVELLRYQLCYKMLFDDIKQIKHRNNIGYYMLTRVNYCDNLLLLKG